MKDKQNNLNFEHFIFWKNNSLNYFNFLAILALIISTQVLATSQNKQAKVGFANDLKVNHTSTGDRFVLNRLVLYQVVMVISENMLNKR